MKKYHYLIAIFFLASNISFAQKRKCATYSERDVQEQIHPDYKIRRLQMETALQQWIQNNKSATSNTDSIFIPVVVHVLWSNAEENISDSQVLSQFTVLNDDYNGTNADTVNTPSYFKLLRGKTNFYFRLAKQDPDGLPTNGINRVHTNIDTGFGLDGRINFTKFGGQDPWDPRYYVNIYVCKLAESTNTFAATYFPGGSLRRDGILCDYHYFGTVGITTPPYDKGRTITHEMGHYFDLDHTWGPTDLTSLPDCTDDDHVEDTPPESVANWGCPQFPHPSCIKNISDPFMDYMDYTDDPCMNLFTQGQAERMRASYYVMTPYLKQSKALQEPLITRNDAGIKEILMPVNNAYTCGKKIFPRVVVRNYGTQMLNTVTITYFINDAQKISATFTNLGIAAYAADTIKLSALELTAAGSISFVAYTSRPNGITDENKTNDKALVTFNNNIGSAVALPFKEDFSSLKFPPKGWSVINPDGLFTWVPTAGSLLSGYAPSVMIDNIEFPKRGELDELVTPPLDLSHATHPYLIFDHGFALYKFGRPKSDSLKVLLSADCGETWTTVFYKGGKDLSTATNGRYGYFSPDTKSDWKKDVVDLSAFSKQANVMISFQNISGEENLLYIDNIVVKDSTSSFANAFAATNAILQQDCNSIQVSPNPVAQSFNITGLAGNTAVIKCINTYGQLLWQNNSGGASTFQLPASITAGVYFMNISMDNKTCVKKIIVHR